MPVRTLLRAPIPVLNMEGIAPRERLDGWPLHLSSSVPSSPVTRNLNYQEDRVHHPSSITPQHTPRTTIAKADNASHLLVLSDKVQSSQHHMSADTLTLHRLMNQHGHGRVTSSSDTGLPAAPPHVSANKWAPLPAPPVSMSRPNASPQSGNVLFPNRVGASLQPNSNQYPSPISGHSHAHSATMFQSPPSGLPIRRHVGEFAGVSSYQTPPSAASPTHNLAEMGSESAPQTVRVNSAEPVVHRFSSSGSGSRRHSDVSHCSDDDLTCSDDEEVLVFWR